MIENIAIACYSAINTIKESRDVETESWFDIEDQERDLYKHLVKEITDGFLVSGEGVHNLFIVMMSSYGFKYGDEFNNSEKLDPRVKPYEQLSEDNKIYSDLIFSIASSFIPYEED